MEGSRFTVLVTGVLLSVLILSARGNEQSFDQEFGVNRDVGVDEIPAAPKHDDHKALFPLDNTDILGMILASVGLMVAAGGGIGGGGILVPLYILVMGFHPRMAIPLANVTIFGGSIANCILNLPKRHPVADRPLIDFDLMLVMEPLTIAGAVVGAIINKLAPEWLVTFCLVGTLAFTSKRTWDKGFSTYEKEAAKSQVKLPYKKGDKPQVVPANEEEDEAEDDEETGESSKLLTDGDHKYTEDSYDWAGELGNNGTLDASEARSKLLEIQEEERHIPMSKISLMVICVAGVVFFNILKGGKTGASPIGVTCGTTSYWFLNLAVVPYTFAIAMWVRNHLLKSYRIKQQVGFTYQEGDVEWDNKTTIVYPVICTAAGLCAGMFGIGGGIVKGPLMLEMGVLPPVSSATAAFMILFTTASAASTYVVFGMLTYDYAIPFFFVGFIFTYLGQKVVDYLVKKYNNSSYIIFSIAVVITLSCILMGYQGITSTIANWGEDRGHGVCD
jgi:uncharacterized membrane protein YfcA